MGGLHGDLNYGLNWLCDKSERVLDFGCGDGELLFLCAERGTKTHVGVDISPMLITKARRRVDKNRPEKFYFRCGGVTEFRALLPSSFDAAIISDVLELLPPEDGKAVLSGISRVLTKKGKALLKLGAYFTPEQAEYHVNQPAVPVWNLTTDEWAGILSESFIIKERRDVYYKDYDRHDRMFLLQKPEG